MCVSRVSDKDCVSKPVGLANVSCADKEEGRVIQKHFIGDSKHEWAPLKYRGWRREVTLQNPELYE